MPVTRHYIRGVGGRRNDGWALYHFRETFTHRMDAGDRVIYADLNGLWRVDGCSWSGEPPPDWDESLAVKLETPLVRSYEQEVDYT